MKATITITLSAQQAHPEPEPEFRDALDVAGLRQVGPVLRHEARTRIEPPEAVAALQLEAAGLCGVLSALDSHTYHPFRRGMELVVHYDLPDAAEAAGEEGPA